MTSPTILRSIRASILASVLSLTLTLSTAAAEALNKSHASVRAAIAVQNAVSAGLMAENGILGTAIGLNPGGQIALVIYVNENAATAAQQAAALRATGQIRGIPLHVELTEPFRANRKPGGGGGPSAPTAPSISHKAIQTPPIELGTSGGWRLDSANGFCCGGTLGALVDVNGVQFILSNYHVLEADIVSGGNNTLAMTGQAVIQPGLIDVNCNPANSQNVATLRRVQSLPNHNVDVGIAQVIPGMVSGSILEIGPLSSQTLEPAIGQPVKKSGRTTGLSRSSIAALHAQIVISYENECAGGAAFTKTFADQIIIGNRGSKFLAGGDSGSVMVEDVPTNPRAIGLLYAGSKTSAIANPIDEVLTFVGEAVVGVGTVATMVGN